MKEEHEVVHSRPPVKAPPVAAARHEAHAEAPAPAVTETTLALFSAAGVQGSAYSFLSPQGGQIRPPQLIRALNHVQFSLRRPAPRSTIQDIAILLLARARAGDLLRDTFQNNDDYACFTDEAGAVPPHEAWARAVAEHLTGVPVLDPSTLYAEGQPAIARMLFIEGRYPLAGRAEDAVAAALCIGGWDGGGRFDIGVGRDGLERCGEAIPSADVPPRLEAWRGTLWQRIGAGACFFWEDPGDPRRGHVATLLRKYPPHPGNEDERVLQLWGATAASDAMGSTAMPVFAEPALLEAVPREIRLADRTLKFCGIGLPRLPGNVRADMRPRGRCRLLLRHREGERRLLYRSAWLSMEAEGLSVARLLASLRNAPHCGEIEATWCVNSMCLAPNEAVPDNVPLLDCVSTTKGYVRLFCEIEEGAHRRDEEDAACCQENTPAIAEQGQEAIF